MQLHSCQLLNFLLHHFLDLTRWRFMKISFQISFLTNTQPKTGHMLKNTLSFLVFSFLCAFSSVFGFLLFFFFPDTSSKILRTKNNLIYRCDSGPKKDLEISVQTDSGGLEESMPGSPLGGSMAPSSMPSYYSPATIVPLVPRQYAVPAFVTTALVSSGSGVGWLPKNVPNIL